MSPSGALRPPFETVMPLSKSNRCSLMPFVGLHVAVRSVGDQMVRRAVEEAARHSERHEDVLGDVHLVVVAREQLDDAAEEDDAGVRVAVLACRA